MRYLNRPTRRLSDAWALVVLLPALACASVLRAAPPIPEPFAAVWEQVDIVPMPKRIRLTGGEIPLDGPQPVVLAVGAEKCRQTEIGAEWINRKIAQLKGRPLRIVSTKDLPRQGLAIIIGTRADNPLIKDAAKQGVVDVGPANPGKHGYEIRTSMAKTGGRIYLAGADPVGALYACVSFAELVARRQGRIVWRRAEVRDWGAVEKVALRPFSSRAFETPVCSPRY